VDGDKVDEKPSLTGNGDRTVCTQNALVDRCAMFQLPMLWTNQRTENSLNMTSGELLYISISTTKKNETETKLSSYFFSTPAWVSLPLRVRLYNPASTSAPSVHRTDPPRGLWTYETDPNTTTTNPIPTCTPSPVTAAAAPPSSRLWADRGYAARESHHGEQRVGSCREGASH
jgi:hypothetical protein